MATRVLCLHGQGSNSEIFRQQLKDVRNMMPRECEFCFFDGAYDCEPAPEVLDFFAPPYRTWYNTPTTAKVLDAHKQVRRLVEEQGPFDAVIGFSQGAAVAASLLLHNDLEGDTPLFRAAVFIGSPVPFSHRLDVGIDARRYFGISDLENRQRPNTIPGHLVTDPAYLRNPQQLGEKSQTPAPCHYYQMFHTTVDAARIRVPTGHVYGRADKWYRHSRDLVDLCRADRVTVLEHEGGHEVPRAYAEELCDMIETVLARAAESA